MCQVEHTFSPVGGQASLVLRSLPDERGLYRLLGQDSGRDLSRGRVKCGREHDGAEEVGGEAW